MPLGVTAIANLKARYCRLADLAATDPETAREHLFKLFTNDIVGDYGQGELVGPQEMIDFLCGAIARSSQWMLHSIGSPFIEIASPRRAYGQWVVSVHSKRRDTGDTELILGRYQDEFRRTQLGWRFAKIRFEIAGTRDAID